jgi:hypothetical protein
MARAERTILWTELALTLASGLALRGLARPLVRGKWGGPYLAGAIGAGLLAPLAIGERWSALRSMLVLVGALTTRFAWTEAGKESAEDPHAYFAYTGSADTSAPKRQRHGSVPRPDLPTHGRIRGKITLVQEDRFRLEDALGRGYLFTLGRGLGVGLQQLQTWSARHAVLEVEYAGAPDLGGLAVNVREVVSPG